MATTLRDLLIQRAARLQDRPALSTPDWGTLNYARLRNRVEGVAFGLLAQEPPPESVFCATGTPWDWIAELAAASSGLTWDPAGQAVPPEVLGGPRFNDEAGRGPYHQREQVLEAATPFNSRLDHGGMMTRLRRLNVRLGWDHETQVTLPLEGLGQPPLRGALWSTLYAGAQVALEPGAAWDPGPFANFWEP